MGISAQQMHLLQILAGLSIWVSLGSYWVCDCVDNMLKCPLLTYYQDDLPLHKTAASGYLENYWALVQINLKKKRVLFPIQSK